MNDLLKFAFRCEVWWIDERQSYMATESKIWFYQNCTIACPEVSRSVYIQGRKASQRTDRRPIRVYKLQCDVEKGRQRKLNLVRISWESLYERHPEESLLLSRLSLRQFVTLYLLYQIGNIFRCQLIKAAKSWLAKVFCQDSVTQFCIADQLQ